ncbi:hypothetical protein Bca52824_017312 [Brassica carinata]|uniref:Uncharacterized protein n=1 Tax=Brassica carinata TaxID=52824 RepID=A0A8X7VNU1_BRACI|nr:hypothetical protein Bca52824_017312 [Brassica carinata]
MASLWRDDKVAQCRRDSPSDQSSYGWLCGSDSKKDQNRSFFASQQPARMLQSPLLKMNCDEDETQTFSVDVGAQVEQKGLSRFSKRERQNGSSSALKASLVTPESHVLIHSNETKNHLEKNCEQELSTEV